MSIKTQTHPPVQILGNAGVGVNVGVMVGVEVRVYVRVGVLVAVGVEVGLIVGVGEYHVPEGVDVGVSVAEQCIITVSR